MATKINVTEHTGKKWHFYQGDRLRDKVGRFATEKTEQTASMVVRFERWAWAMAKKWLIYPTVIAVFATVAIFLTYGYVQNALANAAVPKIHVIEKEVPARDIPPILKRIAMAESLDSHYCTMKQVNAGMCSKNAVGTVLINATKDVGRYQISMDYNGSYCLESGFDPFTEKGNEQCAMKLFNERGSQPWEASRIVRNSKGVVVGGWGK